MAQRAEGPGAVGRPGSRRASVSLDRTGNVARAARTFVADALAEWGWDDVEVPQLLVSEVASNVVQHTASATVGVLVHELGPGDVRVEITNEGRGRPSPQPPDPSRVGGHGLAVVAELADGWGVRHGDASTTVWFDLPATRADVG